MTNDITAIIEQNERLVYSIAHYFTNYDNKEDLFQVGCIGLMNAYKNYKEDVGAKFTTYAYPYILGEMKKCVREDKGIKISRELNKLYLKIEKANILLTQKYMREPTIREIALFLEIPEELVVQASGITNSILSIDEPLRSSDSKEVTLHDTIADHSVEINSIIDLKDRLKTLPHRERLLIKLRYFDDLTQNECAKLLGINQVQVSRVEKKALEKLREYMIYN